MKSASISKIILFITVPVVIFTILFIRKPTSVYSDTVSDPAHIVISEVQITGGTGLTNNEFVELYNPTGSASSLSGYRLERKSKTGSTVENLVADFGNKTIPSHGYFLVSYPDYANQINADLQYDDGVGGLSTDNTVTLYDSGDAPVDKLGWGSAEDFEGNVFSSNPSGANQSLERKANVNSDSSSMGVTGSDEFMGNGYDSDDNSVDFYKRSVSLPQNSNSTLEPVDITPTPNETVTPVPTLEPTSTPTPVPTEILTPTPTEEVTPTPAEIITPTPTEEVTPTPVVSPTPTPTEEVTPTPTEELTPSPTTEPSPTLSPTPTIEPTPIPTPSQGLIIGQFYFPRSQTICILNFRKTTFRFGYFFVPHITCTRSN